MQAMQKTVRENALLFGIATIGLLAVIGIAWGITYYDTRARDEAFFRLAHRGITAIKGHMSQKSALFDTMRAVFEASARVGRDGFATISKPVLTNLHCLQRVEWLPRVTRSERSAFEIRARQDGIEGFQFTELGDHGGVEPAQERKDYFPVFYITPSAGNEKLLGLDMASIPIVRDTLRRAVETMRPAATRPLPLTVKYTGYYYFVPVYDNGGDRRKHLKGVIAGVFENHAWLDELGQDQTEFTVFDVTEEAAPSLVYAKTPQTKSVAEMRGFASASPLTASDTIEFAGRRWIITCLPTKAFFANHRPLATHVAFTLGLCLLVGIVLCVRKAIIRAKDVERRVVKRTAELEIARERQNAVKQEKLAILNNIPDIAWLKDTNSCLMAVNMAYGISCGKQPEDLVGKTDLDLWPRDLAEKYRTDDRMVMETRKEARIEEYLERPNGERIWIETIKRPVVDSHGQVIGTTGIARDFTERKKTEEQLRLSETKLRESEETLRSITITAQDAIVMMDGGGRVTFWNAAAEHIFGYKENEIMGRNLHQTLAPARFHDPHLKGLKGFRETGAGRAVGQTLELTGLRKNGEEFPLELSLSSIKLHGKWSATGIIRPHPTEIG